MTLIDKNKTALVVIDLQKGIAGRPCFPHDSSLVVANAAKLADAFRKNNMPVFLVRVTSSADKKDSLQPVTDVPNQMPGNNTPDWADFMPELGRAETDFIITKRQWGAFYGTELDLQLRRRNIDSIVLCGLSTNIGVESTARTAYELGYQQIFVEDAISSIKSKEEHDNTVTHIFPRIGRVRKTSEILSEF